MQKRLLILGGSEFQIPLVKLAKEKGIYTGVVDIKRSAPACSYADIVFEANLRDKKKILEIAKSFSPDGITVGMVDVAIPAYAYCTSMLNLPGMDEETAKKSTNKYEMIEVFKEHMIPHPAFQYISKEDLNSVRCELPYPVIIKPIDMAGSRGIYLVSNNDEFQDALRKSSLSGNTGNILVEEYMEGSEVSVELVVIEGEPFVIQITDKMTSGAPHFAEIGHLQPSQLRSETKEKIKEVACAATRALGIKNSLGHAEIKVTGNEPKMVEIGARAGGDGIAEQLIELSTGVSFNEIAIKMAFGEKIEKPDIKFERSSCIQFILSKRGILKKIECIDEASLLPGIEQLKIYGKIGQAYEDMVDNSGRIGYVISGGESPEQAICANKKALSLLNIVYD